MYLANNFYASIAQAVALLGHCLSHAKIIRIQNEK